MNEPGRWGHNAPSDTMYICCRNTFTLHTSKTHESQSICRLRWLNILTRRKFLWRTLQHRCHIVGPPAPALFACHRSLILSFPLYLVRLPFSSAKARKNALSIHTQRNRGRGHFALNCSAVGERLVYIHFAVLQYVVCRLI